MNAPELDAAALRRLARGLVFDGDAAGDVVQEAWLAALRRDPHAEPAQGWLAGAVKRIALGRRRAETRRRARESLAARPEPDRTPEDVPERLEVLRALLAALERLDEPYRAAVVMRYLDDLPPREIARRSGVPVDTARTHVRRGLERLRRDLDGPEGRGREALLGALLPLAGPLPWKVAAGAMSSAGWSSSLAGALLVKKVLWTAVACVALSLGAWFVLREPAHPDVSLAAVTARNQEPVKLGTPTATREPNAVAGEADRAAVLAPTVGPTWTQRGRLTIGVWKPLPRGKLFARVLRGAGLEGELLDEQTLVADDRGIFTWTHAAPTEIVTLALRGDMPDAICTTTWGAWAPGDPADEPWMIRVYPIDLELRGRVIGPDGQALPDALVVQEHYERDLETRCDAEGRFRIMVASSFDPGRLQASAAGFTESRVRFVPPEVGGVLELPDIQLAPADVVSGRVVNEEGTPVAGAQVSTWSSFRRCTVTAGEDAKFEVGCIAAGSEHVEVYVRSEGYALSQASLPVGGPASDVVLRRGLTLTGRVMRAFDGRPVSNARIEYSDRFGRGGEPFTYTDAWGRFSLSPIPAGSPQPVWIGAPGFAQTFVELDLPPEVRTHDVGDLTLDTERVLLGRALDSDGEPLAWALVSVEDPKMNPYGRGSFARQGTHTDEAGRFVFHRLPDTRVKLCLLADRHARHELTLEQLDGTEVVLRPQRAAGLAGRVLDAASGEPIPRFRVAVNAIWNAPEEHRLSVGTDWHNGVWITNPEGVWLLEDDIVADAWVDVNVEAEGYAPARIERAVTTVHPDPSALVVKLVRETLLRGRVVDPEGAPVFGATVALSGSRDGPATTTDRDGRFELRGLPTGEATLAVHAEGFARRRDGPFEIGGAAVERRIELDHGASLSGRLLGDDGEPIQGERIELIAYDGDDSQADRELTTDADGRFAFATLAPGSFDLSWKRTLHDETWAAQSRRFDIVGVEHITADLGASGSASLTVSIRSEVALPEGTRVRLVILAEPDLEKLRRDGQNFRADSSRTLFVVGDRTEVRGLEPGRYIVSGHVEIDPKSMLFGTVRQIEVKAGQHAEAELLLAPPPR